MKTVMQETKNSPIHFAMKLYHQVNQYHTAFNLTEYVFLIFGSSLFVSSPLLTYLETVRANLQLSLETCHSEKSSFLMQSS